MKILSDTLDQNLEALATEMIALKYFSCRVVRKEPKRMEGWLEKIQSAMTDFDELRGDKLKGDHLNNLSSSGMLNQKVIESLKAAIALKKDVKAILESIQPLQNEVKTDKPKVKIAAPFKNYIETSLTDSESDKSELEVVFPWKKVMQTSEVKLVKPMHFTPAEVRRFTMTFSSMIGADEVGETYKGQFPNGQQIFVTVLEADNKIEEELFMAEVKTMFRISQQSLVKLYGFCFHQNIKALVHEYVDNGSLANILYHNNHPHIMWEKLYEIAVKTAIGLSYLHNAFQDQIIHGDFCPSNVLLDSNFSPKVKYSGFAKLTGRDKTQNTSARFRPKNDYSSPKNDYSSPEMYTSKLPITDKCDVYSFGMMLFEIFCRNKNTQNGEWEVTRIWDNYQKGRVDELVHEWGVGDNNKEKAKALCKVAFWCLQYKSATRPSMSTVVKMLNMEVPVTTPPYPFKLLRIYVGS